jgi:hypothetical protein
MRLMGLADWPRYWVDHGLVQVSLALTFALFCLVRLSALLFAGIDYAVHFHGVVSRAEQGLRLPAGQSERVPYLSSVRLMNTGRVEIPETDLPGGVIVTVRPVPAILVGQVASAYLPPESVAIEPVGPASVAVLPSTLRPGDWVDVDLLTDHWVTIDSVRVAYATDRRVRAPRRRRLRPYDGAQWAADAIGLPIAAIAVVLVGRALPAHPTATLDVVAAYAWFPLLAWLLLSLWGFLDHTLRFATRRRWQGHPRVYLRVDQL